MTWHELLTMRSAALSKRVEPEKDHGARQVAVCRHEGHTSHSGADVRCDAGPQSADGDRPQHPHCSHTQVLLQLLQTEPWAHIVGYLRLGFLFLSEILKSLFGI